MNDNLRVFALRIQRDVSIRARDTLQEKYQALTQSYMELEQRLEVAEGKLAAAVNPKTQQEQIEDLAAKNLELAERIMQDAREYAEVVNKLKTLETKGGE